MSNTELKTINDNQLMQESDPLLSMIDRVCTDSNFDIEKMQKLIDMRNQELDRQAKIKFNADFANMQGELPRVIAKHYNNQTKSNYAKLEDINKVISPVLKKHGFGDMFKVLSQDKDGVTVEARITHKHGHVESTTVFMPLDIAGIAGTKNKTMVHATGSTITYAKRFAICSLLNISTGEDVDGNQENPVINEKQFEQLQKLIEESKADIVKLCEAYSINSLSELPLIKLNQVTSILEKKIKINQKNQENDNT